MVNFYWGLIVQRFVRSFKIVFNQPFGQVTVKGYNVRSKIAKHDKLILQCPIEAFIDRIIFGGARPAVIPGQPRLRASLVEKLGEFRTVISLDVFYAAIRKIE